MFIKTALISLALTSMSYASELPSQEECLETASQEFARREIALKKALKAEMDLCDSSAYNGIEDRCYMIAARHYEKGTKESLAMYQADKAGCL